MYSLLFRNRWIALGWVALTAASVGSFFAEDGGVAKLADAAEKVRAQRTAMAVSAPRPVQMVAPEEEAPVTFGPTLLPVPGSTADPANPQPGDVFIEAMTGRRVRVVPRDQAAGLEPAFPQP